MPDLAFEVGEVWQPETICIGQGQRGFGRRRKDLWLWLRGQSLRFRTFLFFTFHGFLPSLLFPPSSLGLSSTFSFRFLPALALFFLPAFRFCGLDSGEATVVG